MERYPTSKYEACFIKLGFEKSLKFSEGEDLMAKLTGCIFRAVVLGAFFLLPFSAGTAMGAGFALIEQSVSGLGNAFAGGAASAEDASTVFFNPAGLTLLTTPQFIAGAHVVIPSAKFSNDSSRSLTGALLTGGNGGDGGVTGVVPNLYYSRKLTDTLFFGLGINSPFGLSTEYDKTWVGRYHAVKSEMITLNINPSLAFTVNDRLSIGAGISAQYLKAKLSNAIDFGALINPALSQSMDGFVELKGDSWGFGYNLGLLLLLDQHSRIGLSYRSRIHHKVKGDADSSGAPAGLVFLTGGWFTDTDVEASVELPDSASVSFFHQINPQWNIMADATWTDWSIFDELRFTFSNGQPDGVTTESWKNSFRYSLGLSYIPTNQLIIRAGAAYDQTPIKSAEYRTPRIPDGERLWLAMGLGYKITEKLQLDVGYTHIFVNDPEINKSVSNPEDTIRGSLKGSFDAHVDILNAQVKWLF